MKETPECVGRCMIWHAPAPLCADTRSQTTGAGVQGDNSSQAVGRKVHSPSSKQTVTTARAGQVRDAQAIFQQLSSLSEVAVRRGRRIIVGIMGRLGLDRRLTRVRVRV